jgi:hypothetical protein
MWFGEASFDGFRFRILEGNVAHVTLNSFLDATVADSFEEKLSAIRECSGLVLDLRKNHGGSDTTGYRIVSHFLRHPTETIMVQSPRHVGLYRASGQNVQGTPDDQVSGLHERVREQLLCYRRQWMHEESWGVVEPIGEVLSLPTVLLTSTLSW